MDILNGLGVLRISWMNMGCMFIEPLLAVSFFRLIYLIPYVPFSFDERLSTTSNILSNHNIYSNPPGSPAKKRGSLTIYYLSKGFLTSPQNSPYKQKSETLVFA